MINPIYIKDLRIFDVIYTNRFLLIISGVIDNRLTFKLKTTKSEFILREILCPQKNVSILESEVCDCDESCIELFVDENFIEKINFNKYPDLNNKIIMSTLVRDEDDYILQWIEYHQSLGVDNFIIYNDSKIDTLSQKLRDLIEKGVVILINWYFDIYEEDEVIDRIGAGKKQQTQQNHSLYVFRNTNLIGFFDVDEYLNPQIQVQNLKDYFTQFLSESNLDISEIGGFEFPSKIFLNTQNKDESGYEFLKISECGQEFIRISAQKLFVYPKNVDIFSVHNILVGKKGIPLPESQIYFNHYVFLNKKNRNWDGRNNRGRSIDEYSLRNLTPGIDETILKKLKNII